MRKFIYCLSILISGVLVGPASAQEHMGQVSSQGGKRSEGGGYTNFSVIGGEVVEQNISGGAYSGMVGMVLSTASLRSVILEDSLVLVALYNSTTGNEWTGSDKWLSSNLNQGWLGVTLENRRVTQLSLPENNISGRIPADITSLDSLSSVELQNNQIIALPDMASLSKLSLLDVSGNKLEFGSLEANASIPGINYQNQDSVGQPLYLLIPVGSDTTVQLRTSGTANSYQWYYDGQPITGATKDSVGIWAIDRSNMGKYYAEVSNSLVPGLTLTSNFKEVLATATLNGQVRLSDATPLPEGEVKLLRIREINGFDTTNIAAVDANGFYEMDSVILYDYIFVAVADTVNYRDHLPTYYTNSIFWEEADTLRVDANLNVDIDLVKFENLTLNGDGVITGIFEEDVPDNGRVMVRKRIKSAGVSVRRGVRSGRKNNNINSKMLQEYEPVAFIYTDENGEFTFENLEPDTYRINFQYPGYPMDTASGIDLVIGESYLNKKLSVEALVQDNVIKLEAQTVVGVDQELAAQISVYPNPATRFVNIHFGDLDQNQMGVKLFDNKGSEIAIRMQKENKDVSLDLNALQHGIYILQIFDESRNEVIKVFKLAVSK
ncbi:MAG: T9SS type A sorting domain-containing protein [Candidatus Cyclobacteriaceae bacterium M2_1C_046]